MTHWLRAYLAAAATRERDARQKHFPAMVERGEIPREQADAEIAAWRVLTTLFTDSSVETDLSWSQLEQATARALERRSAAADAAPGRSDLAVRRDAVAAIHDRISWHRAYYAPGSRVTALAA